MKIENTVVNENKFDEKITMVMLSWQEHLNYSTHHASAAVTLLTSNTLKPGFRAFYARKWISLVYRKLVWNCGIFVFHWNYAIFHLWISNL